MTYHLLKRELSPTSAATQFFNAIPTAVNMGQGREVDDPKGKIGDLLKAPLTTSSKYSVTPGGSMELREAAGAWMSRFMGLPADAENTFVIQELGREGLGYGFKIGALDNEPGASAIVPDTRWPMIDEKLADERLGKLEYHVQRDGMADLIGGLIDGASKDVAACYLNFPHNPTGMHISVEENKKIMDVLDKANEGGRKIIRIDDIPYFGGCPQNDSAPYLQTGYDGVLSRESKTKWMAVMSFSKAFGTASPGLTVMVVHPDMAKDIYMRLYRACGLAFVPAFFDNVAQIFAPENDQEVLKHFAWFHEKYSTNRQVMVDTFGDMVLEGDAGMTSLIRVPADVFGKAVTCSDGEVRTMNDLNDIIEFLGNEGVITVNNGKDLLRIAQAAHPDKFKEGVERLKAALDKILQSPCAAAA